MRHDNGQQDQHVTWGLKTQTGFCTATLRQKKWKIVCVLPSNFSRRHAVSSYVLVSVSLEHETFNFVFLITSHNKTEEPSIRIPDSLSTLPAFSFDPQAIHWQRKIQALFWFEKCTSWRVTRTQFSPLLWACNSSIPTSFSVRKIDGLCR